MQVVAQRGTDGFGHRDVVGVGISTDKLVVLNAQSCPKRFGKVEVGHSGPKLLSRECNINYVTFTSLFWGRAVLRNVVQGWKRNKNVTFGLCRRRNRKCLIYIDSFIKSIVYCNVK